MTRFAQAQSEVSAMSFSARAMEETARDLRMNASALEQSAAKLRATIETVNERDILNAHVFAEAAE